MFEENSSHWNQIYLPFETMIPYVNVDSLLSIFSLELIELPNVNIYTDKSKI